MNEIYVCMYFISILAQDVFFWPFVVSGFSIRSRISFLLVKFSIFMEMKYLLILNQYFMPSVPSLRSPVFIIYLLPFRYL